MDFRKNAIRKISLCRQNSDDAPASYRRSGVICKIGPQSGLHSVLCEAPRGEVARVLGPRAASLDEPPSASHLAFERLERRLDQLRNYSVSLEVVADGGVAIPAAGEGLGAVRCKTAVVHEPRAGKSLERRFDRRRRERGTLQALGKSALRQVP